MSAYLSTSLINTCTYLYILGIWASINPTQGFGFGGMIGLWLSQSTRVRFQSLNLICSSCSEDELFISKPLFETIQIYHEPVTTPKHKNKPQTAATEITCHTEQQTSRLYKEERLPHPHQ